MKEKFLQYYQTRSESIRLPSAAKQREFGFIPLDRKVMLRHKGFADTNALAGFLASDAFSDAYYSAAYYIDPEASMGEKGWQGADLVFDIDADHIHTPCDKIHDSWICSNCEFAGKGPAPEECPACGSSRFAAKTWTCDVCLTSARSETIKLTRMLLEDFGFSDKEIGVYFSGNRGYHVHIESESVKTLDSLARKEIVDYVIGLGFRTELHSVIDENRRVLGCRNAQGWKRRFADALQVLLEGTPTAQIEEIGLSKRSADFLDKNRGKLLERLKKNSSLDVKGLGIRSWKEIVERVVHQQGAQIDTVVTTDIHRLIRLAGSLHGKTALMKTKAPLSRIDEFDPLEEAVAFRDGHLVVDVTEAPEFRIGDRTHGPFKNAVHVELPTAAALFLCCKGVAKVVEH